LTYLILYYKIHAKT